MVERSEAALDRVFHALANEARRDILRRTAAQRRTVTELAQHFDMSLAAVAKHVRVLDEAKLLVETREGRLHWRRMNRDALQPARDVIDELRTFWNGQLDGLREYLESVDAPSSGRSQKPRPRRSAPAARKRR